MKTMINQVILLALALALSLPFFAVYAGAATVRQAVWAGRFYPADPDDLKQEIDHLTRKAQKTPIRIPHKKYLRAIIMPHAGYIYSGWTAAHASRVLQDGQFSRVILLGPDHRIGFKNAAISDATVYETPLGKISLHQDISKLRRQPDLFQRLPISGDKEHSLEVILPFLQHYLADFQLIPVVVGQGDVLRLSGALDSLLDRDTLLVISSDFSHFLSYAEALARDRETIGEIINLKPVKLIKSDNRACGRMPLLIVTDIARRHNWKPVLLHYSNSGDTGGDQSRVVGYATIAFFGDLPMKNTDNAPEKFSEAQGQVLLKLARQTLVDKLGGGKAAAGDLLADLDDDRFSISCGTFVTLKIKGQLRGCIGNLTSTETVLDGVRRNAVNAALRDPRFPPLSVDELEHTRIEVSILSDPQPLVYRDGQDLLKKLRPHVDGVIIRKDDASATFLPQVWEQLPRPEDFFTHLCMKAGLPSDTWKNSELEVLTYQVQYFEENQ